MVALAEGFALECVSLTDFRPHFAADVSFEILTAPTIDAEIPREDRFWDEATTFCNTIDGIFKDITGLQGTGNGYVSGLSHVKLSRIETIIPPFPDSETRAASDDVERSEYFWAALYRFSGVS